MPVDPPKLEPAATTAGATSDNSNAASSAISASILPSLVQTRITLTDIIHELRIIDDFRSEWEDDTESEYEEEHGIFALELYLRCERATKDCSLIVNTVEKFIAHYKGSQESAAALSSSTLLIAMEVRRANARKEMRDIQAAIADLPTGCSAIRAEAEVSRRVDRTVWKLDELKQLLANGRDKWPIRA